MKQHVVFKMKNMRLFFVFLSGLMLGILYDGHNISDFSHIEYQNKSSINSCFSPDGNCVEFICHEIALAQKEILVQAYSFTSKKIADSLVGAKNRGIRVSILIDKSASTARSSVIPFLLDHGIAISYDKVNGLAHNKIMIIDQNVLITGSFNFTNAANNRNSENLLIIKNQEIVNEYVKNWVLRKQKSSTL